MLWTVLKPKTVKMNFTQFLLSKSTDVRRRKKIDIFFFFFWFWGFLHCGKNTSHEINPLHKLLGVKYSIVSCKIQYCYLYNTVLLAIDTVQYSGYLEFFSSYTTEICTLWLLSLYFPITSPWQPPFYSLLLWVWLF